MLAGRHQPVAGGGAAASNQRDGLILAGDQTTRARRLAALTSAETTPGTCISAASTVNAQAAQCMPSTATCDFQRAAASPGAERTTESRPFRRIVQQRPGRLRSGRQARERGRARLPSPEAAVAARRDLTWIKGCRRRP